jgi:hypothetical protein
MGSLDTGMAATERRGRVGGREGGRLRVRGEDQGPLIKTEKRRKGEERVKQTNKRTIQPIIISTWLSHYYTHLSFSSLLFHA